MLVCVPLFTGSPPPGRDVLGGGGETSTPPPPPPQELQKDGGRPQKSGGRSQRAGFGGDVASALRGAIDSHGKLDLLKETF